MSKQNQMEGKQGDGMNRPKVATVAPAYAAELQPANLLLNEQAKLNGTNPPHAHSALLSDQRLLATQRQTMATEIGKHGGNRYLETVIAAPQYSDSNVRKTPAVNIGRASHQNTVIARKEDAEARNTITEEEDPGFLGTIGGAIMGEFNEDPSFAMIGIDTGVSMIPVLDQVSDLRDILAHLYYLVFRKQYDRTMRWVGIAFTLIGLIPGIGSAIKGASKFILAGAQTLVTRLGEFLSPLRKLFPEMGDISQLQSFIARNWDGWVGAAMSAWYRALGRATRIVSAIPSFLSRKIGFIKDGLARLQEIAPAKLLAAMAWVRRQWDEVSENLGRRRGQAETEIIDTTGETGGTTKVIEANVPIIESKKIPADRPGSARVDKRKKPERGQKRPNLPRGTKAKRVSINNFKEPFKDPEMLKEQQKILELSKSNPQAAGNQYQNLVARDHIGGTEVQEKFGREGRRMDMGTEQEFTIEGMYKGFSSYKLDQLWDDLMDKGNITLTVPSLSVMAKDQLQRLLAQAELETGRRMIIVVRETLP